MRGCDAHCDTPNIQHDFAVSSGYKWLLGPYGTGFFWIAKEWTERLQINSLYFMALEGARNFHSLPLENLRPVAEEHAAGMLRRRPLYESRGARCIT